MKKQLTALLTATLLLTSLTGCNRVENTPSDSSSVADTSNSVTSDSSSSLSNSSSTESTSDENSTSSEYMSYEDYVALKGEELISQFEWPYDDKIDLTGAVAHSVKGDTIEEIAINDISNEFLWDVQCDYGYLAAMPEQGNEYKYQKYKAGDKIGDFTITEIYSSFDNNHYETLKYFAGTKAYFEGEVTLTGEIAILKEELAVVDDIKFYPDEESKKKLPVVDFRMKSDGSDYNLLISLGNKSKYPNIDFSDIPTDGTRVKAEITIEDYGYRAMYGLPFIGGARIVGDIINISPLTPLSFTDEDLELQKTLKNLSNAEKVDFWFQGGAFSYIGNARPIEVINEDNNSTTLHYIKLPKDLKDGELTFPYSYEEMKKTVNKYFTNDATEAYLKNYIKGSVTGELDNVLKVKVNGKGTENTAPFFLELNGEIYQKDAASSAKMSIDIPTAKVEQRGNNVIVFSYLHTYLSDELTSDVSYKYAEPYYENAQTGYLILEDGSWKFTHYEPIKGFEITLFK